jgi:hypothetical protein
VLSRFLKPRAGARTTVTVVLSLFLLAMQQDALLHPLEHLREVLGQAKHPVLKAPESPCQDCVLLASGAHAVDSTLVLPEFAAPVAESIAPAADVLLAAPFVLYRSRGPPLAA